MVSEQMIEIFIDVVSTNCGKNSVHVPLMIQSKQFDIFVNADLHIEFVSFM